MKKKTILRYGIELFNHPFSQQADTSESSHPVIP